MKANNYKLQIDLGDVLQPDHHPHLFLLAWWLVILTFSFFLYVAWDLGYLEMIYQRDRSYLTIVISILCILSTAHAFFHIFQKSFLLEKFRRQGVSGRLADGFNNDIAKPFELTSNDAETLFEIIADRMRSAVEVGWFLVDLAIRLGLAGTIIGFILIFTSLSGTDIVGENALKELLVSMSTGMGTALFTTLTGLVGATYLSIQYLILGRLVEELVAEMAMHGSIELISDSADIS